MANATSLIPLSGSTQGQATKVVATSTPGTLLHTTGTSASIVDRVWLWAFNSDTVVRVLTIEMGGATAPDQNIVLPIPAQSGRVKVIDGEILLGNGSAGLTIKAFCPTANVVTVAGIILRVTP